MPRVEAMVKDGTISYPDGASLVAAGIRSAEDLLFLTRSGFAFVAENAQLSEAEVKGIVKRILRRYCPIPQRASVIFEEWREKNSIIQTGCSSIDELLHGGIFTSEMTELAGPSAVGKTQFCLSVTSRVTCDLQANALYMDSGNSFSPLRLQEIMQEQGCTKEESLMALQRIRRSSVSNVQDLMNEFSDLEAKLESSCGLSKKESDAFHSDTFFVNLKLIVIDSLGSLFAPLLGGVSLVGHCMLLDIVQKLQHLMTKFSIAVIVTNHTTIRGGNPDNIQAAMGETWSRLPCVSLMITTFSSHIRRLTIRKSNKNASKAYAHFLITEKGLSDLDA